MYYIKLNKVLASEIHIAQRDLQQGKIMSCNVIEIRLSPKFDYSIESQ